MDSAPDLVTFGCRLNAYEAEVMQAHARAAGLENAVIINTCAVTGEAERQARQAIRRARRERPDATIIVTGCAAHIAPEAYAAIEGVTHVVSNADKLKPETFRALADANRAQAPLLAAAMPYLPPGQEAGFGGRPRAYIQAQTGCDHRCTFCIIPFGRGPSRSRPVADIVAEAAALAARGYREMVLTGVDLTAYGLDLADRPTLGSMARQVLNAVPGLTRLRLSSLDPVEIDEDVWDLLAHEPRLMPHWHLSLQSGDDLILKRMKRRHTRDDVFRLVDRARRLRPSIAFGADIIAGFPTESDAMARMTADLVERCGLTWLHVFPYSARAGTPAAKMPQIPAPVRKERAAALRALGQRAVARHIGTLTGQTMDVLVEQPGLGRTGCYAEVVFDTPQMTGAVVPVVLTGHDGQRAFARPLDSQERAA